MTGIEYLNLFRIRKLIVNLYVSFIHRYTKLFCFYLIMAKHRMVQTEHMKGKIYYGNKGNTPTVLTADTSE